MIITAVVFRKERYFLLLLIKRMGGVLRLLGNWTTTLAEAAREKGKNSCPYNMSNNIWGEKNLHDFKLTPPSYSYYFIFLQVKCLF